MDTVREYKCLSCNAPIHFDPTLQKWRCDYCRNVYSKQELDEFYAKKEEREENRARALGKEIKKDQPIKEMDSYHCKNCGAEIVGDHETIATFCLYCKSPAIIKARMQGEFDPKYVIPFKINQEQAKKIYAEWIKKHFLAPKQFKLNEEIAKIRGIYAPFWLYNCDKSNIYIKGVGENVRVWRNGDTEYTETRYYSVVREGQMGYSNLPVDGSTKMEDHLMEAIEPFDYGEMVSFSMDYMSGFFAERFDEKKEDLEPRAKKRMDEFSKERIKQTINYTKFNPEEENIYYDHIDADYSLLPIYILTNIYEGKPNQYVVNGQTGKIYGNVPISIPKLAGIFGVTFVASWVILAFLGIF